ncbi:DUF1961 family protein [bacterium]|nr:DUF1961 family protein [bacterium]
MKREISIIGIKGIIILCVMGIILKCNKIPDIPPRFQYPGYKSRCIFIENFDGMEPHWQMAGTGTARTSPDSGLIIEPATDSLGVIIWLDKDFEGSYQLEYRLDLHDTLGMHLLFISAAGLQNENVLSLVKNQPGAYEAYADSNIQNYQFSMHCYDPQGMHHPHSRLRKNPGKILLSHIPEDPCQTNRQYTIDFLKIGNRLQLFVDGERYHDFRDKGDRQTLYNRGKIGFWFNGKPGRFSVNLTDIHVYKLIPN